MCLIIQQRRWSLIFNRFCVKGNSVWQVDTTFELTDRLWLTDSSYQNESLINENGCHPTFPGPSMWHFRKTREVYRYVYIVRNYLTTSGAETFANFDPIRGSIAREKLYIDKFAKVYAREKFSFGRFLLANVSAPKVVFM